jgi:hypothetical protein
MISLIMIFKVNIEAETGFRDTLHQKFYLKETFWKPLEQVFWGHVGQDVTVDVPKNCPEIRYPDISYKVRVFPFHEAVSDFNRAYALPYCNGVTQTS